MKPLFILLCVISSLASAQDVTIQPGSEQWRELFDPPFTMPAELPIDKPLRKQLFELLRPHIERETTRRAIRFQGELKAFKNWAFFVGKTLDREGQPVRFAPMDNTETAALWLRTRDGWRLVDYAAGFSDPFYWIWVEQYGVPRQLVSLK